MNSYTNLFITGFIVGVGNGILWSDLDYLNRKEWKRQIIETSTNVFVRSGLGIAIMLTGFAAYTDILLKDSKPNRLDVVRFQ